MPLPCAGFPSRKRAPPVDHFAPLPRTSFPGGIDHHCYKSPRSQCLKGSVGFLYCRIFCAQVTINGLKPPFSVDSLGGQGKFNVLIRHL